MANTLTVKTNITDASGTIPGATPAAGIGLSLTYTQKYDQEIVLGAAATKSIVISTLAFDDAKVIMIVPIAGTMDVEINDGGVDTGAPVTSINVTGGYIMLSEITNGQAIDFIKLTDTGAGSTCHIYAYK